MFTLRSAATAAAAVALLGAPALADAFDAYGRHYRSFSAPPVGDGSFGVAGDALPDGRLVMVTGNAIYLESAAGEADFALVARLDASRTGGATDPAFIQVSPDGSRIAVGAGFARPVAVFPTGALGTPDNPADLTAGAVADYFSVGHFEAAWLDNTRLALSAGDFGSPAFVSLLDTNSDPDSPANPVVVTNIRGASAGVAFDDQGRLYTANGFADGAGSGTGNIRAFDPDDWARGVDFETGGVLIGDVLSGGSLRFDAFGHLIVGGGDFTDFDAGYLGVLHRDALADALAGGGPVDPFDPEQARRLDPRGDGAGFYAGAYNRSTGELYVIDGTTWHATVPAPAGAALLAGAGLCAWRRRRA